MLPPRGARCKPNCGLELENDMALLLTGESSVVEPQKFECKGGMDKSSAPAPHMKGQKDMLLRGAGPAQTDELGKPGLDAR